MRRQKVLTFWVGAGGRCTLLGYSNELALEILHNCVMRSFELIVGPSGKTERRSTFIVSLDIGLTMRMLVWHIKWHLARACIFKVLYCIHSSGTALYTNLFNSNIYMHVREQACVSVFRLWPAQQRVKPEVCGSSLQ